MEAAIFAFLKREMLGRSWNVSRLADACDVDIALAARWVAENPKRRVVPGPKSCAKIAAALDVDPDYVLELAGHRERRTDDLAAPDRLELAFRASLPELREVLDGIDEIYWQPIIGKFLRRAIGEARDYAALVRELRATMPLARGSRANAGRSDTASARGTASSSRSAAVDDASEGPLSVHSESFQAPIATLVRRL